MIAQPVRCTLPYTQYAQTFVKTSYVHVASLELFVQSQTYICAYEEVWA